MDDEYRELNFDDVPADEMRLFCDAVDEQAAFESHFVAMAGWTGEIK